MSTIEVRVMKIVTEILDVRSGKIRGDSSFTDDLGADSLDVVVGNPPINNSPHKQGSCGTLAGPVLFSYASSCNLSAHLQVMCGILQRDYQGHWIKRVLGRTP